MTAGAFQLDAQRVVGQTFRAHLRQRTRQHGTDRTIDVARHFHELHFVAFVDGSTAFLDEHLVQSALQAMVLGIGVVQGGALRNRRHGQQTAEVQTTGFPMFHAFFHVDQIGTANQVVKLGDAQLRHDVAHFFGDKEEIVHHMLGLARKLLAQQGVLGGHAHRAGVEVAFAHHDATFDHQRCGGKTEFIRA